MIERSEMATTATSVFEARGLTKIYDMGEVKVHALRGVDLDLQEGEFVVLLGPSGSGKSTLLNILGGLDVPTAGHVNYRGRDLTAAGDRELTEYRRRHVGFVFQMHHLLPMLSAERNVELPLLLTGLPASERRKRTQAALTLVSSSGSEVLPARSTDPTHTPPSPVMTATVSACRARRRATRKMAAPAAQRVATGRSGP